MYVFMVSAKFLVNANDELTPRYYTQYLRLDHMSGDVLLRYSDKVLHELMYSRLHEYVLRMGTDPVRSDF